MREHGNRSGTKRLASGAALILLLSGCSDDSSSGGKEGEKDGDAGPSGGTSGASSGAGGGANPGGSSSSGGRTATGSGGKSATGGGPSGGGRTAAGGGSSAGGAPGGGGTAGCEPAAPSGTGPRNLFPADHFFYRDVSCEDPSPSSDAIIDALGEWGNGNVFQIDFSITVLEADANTPTRPPGTIEYDGDSDLVPFPFPANGAVEGESGYSCDGGGDCHLLVVNQATRQLFEAWAVNSTSSASYDAGGTSVWDLDRHYGPNGRGAGCTSADAAGFPIVPGLIGVDEVAAGEIRHALRFILPNESMRRHAYVYPATHYGGPDSRNPNSPPYGVRFRLKSTFDEGSISSAGGKVVVRALKRYGMLLSDGGQIALTAESDQYTAARWVDNGGEADLGPHDLRTIAVSDFEVVALEEIQQFFPIDNPDDEWPDCVRE